MQRRLATLPCWRAAIRHRTILNTHWTFPVPLHAPDPGWASWERRWPEAFFGSESRRFSTRAEDCHQSPVQGLWLQWLPVQLHPPCWRPARWTTHRREFGPAQAAWFTHQYCKRHGRSRRQSLPQIRRWLLRRWLLRQRQERFLRIQLPHPHRRQGRRRRQIPPKKRDNWKTRFYAVTRLRT